jgi:ADP-L-glycero-D-manno-heptose 6-epimerase
MKIIITGSDGFIGSNLKKYLETKEHNVTGFDIKNYAEKDKKKAFTSFLDSIPIFDAVIHLGANSSTTETNFNKILKENFLTSKLIFERCEEEGIIFQYASSASIYGKSRVFKEDGFYNPLSPYAMSKYMFDCFLLTQDYRYQGFRYFNVYGNGEDHKKNQSSPIFKFLKDAKEKKEIILFNKKSIRDFVCVEDVCEVHELMLQKEYATGVFNVGTGDPISFKQVANLVKNKTGANINIKLMPDNLKNHYQQYTCADLEKLNSVIGNKKWISVEEYINKKSCFNE